MTEDGQKVGGASSCLLKGCFNFDFNSANISLLLYSPSFLHSFACFHVVLVEKVVTGTLAADVSYTLDLGDLRLSY